MQRDKFAPDKGNGSSVPDGTGIQKQDMVIVAVLYCMIQLVFLLRALKMCTVT